MQLQLQSRKKLTFYQLLLKVGYLLMFWNALLLTIKITASSLGSSQYICTNTAHLYLHIEAV